MTFFNWLVQQTSRADDVGTFARYAASDKAFPRQRSELHVVLLRYEGMPTHRDGAKQAHREWRYVKSRCSHCNGFCHVERRVAGDETATEVVKCPACGGTGRRFKR